MPRPTAKLTLVEVQSELGEVTGHKPRRMFEVVKAENTIRFAIGEEISERDVQSLSASGVRTTLIRRKT